MCPSRIATAGTCQNWWLEPALLLQHNNAKTVCMPLLSMPDETAFAVRGSSRGAITLIVEKALRTKPSPGRYSQPAVSELWPSMRKQNLRQRSGKQWKVEPPSQAPQGLQGMMWGCTTSNPKIGSTARGWPRLPSPKYMPHWHLACLKVPSPQMASACTRLHCCLQLTTGTWRL